MLKRKDSCTYKAKADSFKKKEKLVRNMYEEKKNLRTEFEVKLWLEQ